MRGKHIKRRTGLPPVRLRGGFRNQRVFNYEVGGGGGKIIFWKKNGVAEPAPLAGAIEIKMGCSSGGPNENVGARANGFVPRKQREDPRGEHKGARDQSIDHRIHTTSVLIGNKGFVRSTLYKSCPEVKGSGGSIVRMNSSRKG